MTIINDDDEEYNDLGEPKQFIRKKFTRVPEEFFKYGTHLTKRTRDVFVALCSFRNTKTGETFPSYPKIMGRCSVRRQDDVSSALIELEYFGWADRQRRFNRSNKYYLCTPDHESPTKEEAEEFPAILDQIKRRNKRKKTDKNWELKVKIAQGKQAAEELRELEDRKRLYQEMIENEIPF